MYPRHRAVPMLPSRPLVFVFATALWPASSHGQGLSASFDDTVAVLGQDLAIGVSVDAPPKVIAQIRVEVRMSNAQDWLKSEAQLVDEASGQWRATFSAKTMWSSSAPHKTVEVRAYLYGRRGGLLFVLGELAPLEVEVMRPAEAQARDAALRVRPELSQGPPLILIGYIGLDTRAGSNARTRVFIQAGGAPTAESELLLNVSIGPTFDAPARLDNGGPLVLGLEGAFRHYHRRPGAGRWAAFITEFVTTDIRFPGVDVGGGLRAGVLWWLGPEVALSASLGGAAMLFGVAGDPEDLDPELGFAGGLRIALRFGAERTQPEATP